MSGETITQTDIERIVRLVIADLGLAGGGPPAVSPAPAPSVPEAAELRLTSRVITLQQVRGAAPSVRRVFVPRGAVVTPSVRDELKKLGRELVFDGVSDAPKRIPAAGFGAGGGRFTLAASNSAVPRPAAAARGAGSAESVQSLSVAFHGVAPETLPPSLIEQLGKTMPVEVYQNKCVMQTAEFLAERLLREKSKAVLLTKYPAAASAVCNRKPAIRGMVGFEPDRLEKEAASIGANLLIADPAFGPFQVRRMITRFVGLGAAECPSVLRKGLGS